MRERLNGILKYSSLMLILIVGILSCSIGVTWCRYQVRQNYDINFIARNPGDYHISKLPEGKDVGEWCFDPEKGRLRTDFMITNGIENYPEQDTSFCLRLLATEGVTLQPEVVLTVIDLGGCETEYVGIPKVLSESDEETKDLYEEVGNGALYCFLDEDGKELALELKGGERSSQICSISISNVPESFLAEVIVLDSSYAIEKINTETIFLNNGYSLESNYLSVAANRIILLDTWIGGNSSSSTADITLTANGITSLGTISCTTDSPYVTASLEWLDPIPEEAAISTSQVVHFEEEGNKSIRLKIVPIQSAMLGLVDTVFADIKVTWESQGPQVEPLSAVFRVAIKPNAGVDAVDLPFGSVLSFIRLNEHAFDQTTPIQLEIITDGSYDTVKLQNGENWFPANTRYSVDDGNSWYVLQKSGTIDVGVQLIESSDVIDGEQIESVAANKVNLLVDLSDADIIWDTGAYTVTGKAYYKGKEVTSAEAVFTMNNKDIPIMSVVVQEGEPIVTDQKSWYADANYSGEEVDVVTYTTERLTIEGYRSVTEEDAIIVSSEIINGGKSTRVTITTAEGKKPAAGTYRITFIQTYDGKEVEKESVYFFVNYRYGN